VTSLVSVPAVVRRYLKAMESGDLAAVLDCFAANGVVASPVYGVVTARDFYERLFADTIRVELRIRDLYQAQGRPDRAIAYFDYIWERHDKPLLETRLIDFFDFDSSNTKIAQLRIVLDQTPEN
jgi:ketosteroid isomerase-like protein